MSTKRRGTHPGHSRSDPLTRRRILPFWVLLVVGIVVPAYAFSAGAALSFSEDEDPCRVGTSGDTCCVCEGEEFPYLCEEKDENGWLKCSLVHCPSDSGVACIVEPE